MLEVRQKNVEASEANLRTLQQLQNGAISAQDALAKKITLQPEVNAQITRQWVCRCRYTGAHLATLAPRQHLTHCLRVEHTL